MSSPPVVRALVVAKAPVPGLAKTRLGEHVGHVAAADLAAAAILDTLEACAAAFRGTCHLALAGDLQDAPRADDLRAALRSWHVFAQQGESLGERLAHAHSTLAAEAPGPVVQVGMDTPQLTSRLLSDAGDALRPGHGVIGPATDGGWWLLGLAEPADAVVLAEVPMSTPRTGFDTRRALTGWGVRLASTRTLRDVDTVADAALVAREAPGTRFADAWSRVAVEVA
jgi:rSAM/selenodomain-associated transferase 1